MKEKKSKSSAAESGKAEKRAQALRQNLLKRKQQTRGRDDTKRS